MKYLFLLITIFQASFSLGESHSFTKTGLGCIKRPETGAPSCQLDQTRIADICVSVNEEEITREKPTCPAGSEKIAGLCYGPCPADYRVSDNQVRCCQRP